ncbi:hypothetical protein IWW36_000747 [Coemansia brasiliensis]|uniref:ArfGap-domain-containing protein n=1 Tax=Coemansia brasiliensis TaxID=2650707 RepID=A0A9W8IAE7_9FUNG|nr:hypothetical protein IWW36_000747 [Coemansia brasiliensis]
MAAIGRLSVVIENKERRDEYVLANTCWRMETAGGEPPLLRPIGKRGVWGAVAIDDTEIPAQLGVVPAYMGPQSELQVSVLSSGPDNQEHNDGLSVAVSVQSKNEAASSQRVDVQREATQPGLLRAQWRPDSSILRGRAGVVTVQIAGHTGSRAASFAFYAGTTAVRTCKESTEEVAVVGSEHVFGEMLQHHAQRTGETEGSQQQQHPLFGRWVGEDSPQFRQTIASMESQAQTSRAQYKEISRQAGALGEASEQFLRVLDEALGAAEGLAVARPLAQTFLEPLRRDIGQLLRTVCGNWDAVVVTQARRQYEGTFRALDERKTAFDAASTQFYGDMTKHLKTKATRGAERRDEAFERSRMAFDAARWAYFLELWTATHGWSALEMFVALLTWAKSVARTREAAQLQTGALAWLMQRIPAACEEARLQKSESTEFQAFVENPYGGVVRAHALTPTDGAPESSEYVRVSLESLDQPPVQLQRPPPMRQSASTSSVALRLSTDSQTARAASGSSLDLARQLASVSLGRPLDIPPSTHSSEQLQRDGVREGVLYARVSVHGSDAPRMQVTTGRNMRAAAHNGWRQYWCVVRNGTFRKFSGWREGRMEPRGAALDLSLATVRVLDADSKQAGRRRFCFEIITPTYYGVFQAAGAAEMAAWVEVLRRAIELRLLQGDAPRPSTSSDGALPPGRRAAVRLSRMSQLSDFESITTLASSLNESSASVASARDDEAARGQRAPMAALLPMLQQDEANEHCADCSAPHPDWCSLNLGCLLCIACSGVHRSLGTHVSKVRSLTLDVTSFTPVVVALLLATGNAVNRAVFAPGALPAQLQRPAPDSPPHMRQQFIAAKYVRRALVDRSWRPEGRLAHELSLLVPQPVAAWDRCTASALLFAAISVGDAAAALRAVVLGADVSSTFMDSVGEHALLAPITPLLAALFGVEQIAQLVDAEHSAHNSDSAASDNIPIPSSRAQLEIAELLMLNGASASVQDCSGRSALHWACVASSTAAAKMLIDKGVDPLLRDRNGQRAVDLVADTNHAVRAVILPATQQAEERQRQEAAQQWDAPSPERSNGRSLRRPGSMGSITSSSQWNAPSSRNDNPVINVARRFTQSLAPALSGPSFVSRMSVSTERPSLLELSGGGSSGADARRGPRGTGGGLGIQNIPAIPRGEGGWLSSLGPNKRGRRLTNGIRDLGARIGAPSRGADGMTTIDEAAPMLPTILSAGIEDDESMLEVLLETGGSPNEQPTGGSSTAFSAPSTPAPIVAARGSSVSISPMVSRSDSTGQHLSRHSSMRSTRSGKPQVESPSVKTPNLPYYMFATQGQGSSPIKLRSHLDISSAGSSFVDVREADGHMSPLQVTHIPTSDYNGVSKPQSNRSRASLALFSFGNDDPHDRSSLMAKLLPGNGHKPAMDPAENKRSSRILLRRGTTASNILRPSSSADGLSQARLQADMRPPTSNDARLRSKLRLLPKSSRMALHGFFGRSKQSVHHESEV